MQNGTGLFCAEKGRNVIMRNKSPEPGKIGLVKLFLLFVKIGLVTIGGGYVMIPLLQEEFVEKRKLMEIKEFANIMAVAQAGPGGVAVNSSVVVGYKLKGLSGAIAAAVGTVLPSFAAIILLSAWLLHPGNRETLEGFLSGATPAVVGLLIAAAYSLGREVIEDKMGAVLAAGGLAAVVLLDIHPIIIIIAAGAFGYFFYKNKCFPGDEEGCDNHP